MSVGVFRSRWTVAGSRLAALAGGVLVVTNVAGNAQNPPPRLSQQGSSWCWAGVTEMVMRGLDPSPNDYSQALQAESVVNGCLYAPRNTCKNVSPVYAGCNRPGFPTFGVFDHVAETTPSPLTWTELAGELDAGRPVVFGWCIDKHCGTTPQTSLGHWMVAVEAASSDDVPWVRVYNPAPCCLGQVLWIPYTTFAEGITGLRFWQNYYDARPRGTPPHGLAHNPVEGRNLTPIPEVDDVDKLKPGADAGRLLTAVRACRSNTGARSGPFRDAGVPPEAQATVSYVVLRHYVPLVALGTMTSTARFEEAAVEFHRIAVVAVEFASRAFANLVFEETGDKSQSTTSWRLIAVEDAESARRQIDRAKMSGSGEEFVIVETGLHLAIKDGNAIVIASERDCREPKPNEQPEPVPIDKLIELLTVSR